MTTELEPIRWTESSDDAPELLRAPFAAASREGPSAAQMRMLAVKLAAVAAGSAVTASAASAQASATASSTLTGGAAASTALPFAKIVAAVAVVGATALGGVALFHQPTSPRGQAPVAQDRASAVNVSAPEVEAPQGLPTPTATPIEARQEAAHDVDARSEIARDIDAQARAVDGTRVPSKIEATSVKRATQARASKANVARAANDGVAASQEAHQGNSKVDVPSEVELLRRARTALSARPREAFALTEQHREHYPRGVFAQERDALAIEALLRAGDTDTARSLAKRFVSAHPSSPHAHRFRETLGLR